MATDVIMPQMGESIAEGTVTRWIKKVGETVERDEPLLEISTDKVDAEIPSPAAGTLTEILAQEGETVAVNAVVARIAAAGDSEAAAPKDAPAAEESQAPAPPPEPAPAAQQPPPAPAAPTRPPEAQTETAPAGAGAVSQPAPASSPSPAGERVTSIEERRRTRSSPLVRKIARENDIDISGIEGSGVSGRVTKSDILDYMSTPPEQRRTAPPQKAPAAQPATAPHTPVFAPGDAIEIEPMSMMRRRIAEHMVMSKRTSAHVTTVFEVDFTNIDRLRKLHKADYAERGARLTYLPFIVQAVITGLREFPIINASIDGDNIVHHKDINIGIAVALDWGLIVPVLKRADEKNVLGIARSINDLGDRARMKKLSPDDVQGGTFTITNPGVYGGLFGTPIINQPQVAILGVGGVKKRAVVIETEEGDAIVVRSMCILSLTFDHRLIDGAIADQFMARVQALIEEAQFAL